MKLKFKIVFFNFMIFLIIFDIIYLIVWMFSIQMNPLKAFIVTALAALITPWVRATNLESGSKVYIRSYASVIWNKYMKKTR